MKSRNSCSVSYTHLDVYKRQILGREDNVVTNVPIVGTVTAGAPILAFEQIEGTVAYSGHTDVYKRQVFPRV